jgi:hypothetical protein
VKAGTWTTKHSYISSRKQDLHNNTPMVQTLDIISNNFNVASHHLTGEVVRSSANTCMLKFIAIPKKITFISFYLLL